MKERRRNYDNMLLCFCVASTATSYPLLLLSVLSCYFLSSPATSLLCPLPLFAMGWLVILFLFMLPLPPVYRHSLKARQMNHNYMFLCFFVVSSPATCYDLVSWGYHLRYRYLIMLCYRYYLIIDSPFRARQVNYGYIFLCFFVVSSHLAAMKLLVMVIIYVTYFYFLIIDIPKASVTIISSFPSLLFFLLVTW